MSTRHKHVECFRRKSAGCWELQYYLLESNLAGDGGDDHFHLNSIAFSDTLYQFEDLVHVIFGRARPPGGLYQKNLVHLFQ